MPVRFGAGHGVTGDWCHEENAENNRDDDDHDDRDGNEERRTCTPLSSAIVADTLGRRWRLHSPLSGVTVILQNALSLVDVSADAPGFARPFSFRIERRTLRFVLHRSQTYFNPFIREKKKKIHERTISVIHCVSISRSHRDIRAGYTRPMTRN